MARLIFDTSIAIAAERRGTDVREGLSEADDVAIAAITAAELLIGVERAVGRERLHRQQAVEDVLSTLPIEPYDLAVARAHASLIVHTRAAGTPRGSHDLMIAATALATERTVLTADRRGFADLPGVRVRVVG